MVGAVASHSVYVNIFQDPLLAITHIGRVALGVGMAGPLLTGFSQVINEYCDRDVDAINQPDRLIPAGKVGRRHVMIALVVLLVLALGAAAFLGSGVFWVTLLGVALAMAYSMPPLRLKRNGWFGNFAVAIAYEGLAWIAGHLAFQMPISSVSLWPALLYSICTHGIMTINDFKSVNGDRLMGIRSIPVQYGPRGAAWLAVITIVLGQVAVLALMLVWGYYISAGIIVLLGLVQARTLAELIRKPTNEMAVRYNIYGIPPLVWGMIAAAARL